MIQVERLAPYAEVYQGYAEIFHEYMAKYNLLDMVFYDSNREISKEDIECLLLSGSPYILRWKSELVGFIVLTNRHIYRAELTFCTWPPFWGRGSVERGKEVLQQLFALPENIALKTVQGFMSILNKAGCKFAEEIGFHAVYVGDGCYYSRVTKQSEALIIRNYMIER